LKWNEEIFWEVAKNIEPLDHRIKMVKEFWWIKIYDDWICTSSQALNVALNSFNEKITLIAGGYDKWDDYTWLANELEKKVWFACLIWQTAKKFEVILKEKNIDYKIFEKLEDAVLYAINETKKLWIKNILFSPWSASFDMFENVYDRCDQFIGIIDNLW
jgi:UDP-N-acetylmuramoylalanine--D-glutamate ligase